MDTETAKRIVDAQCAADVARAERDAAFACAFRRALNATGTMGFGAPYVLDWTRPATRPFPLPFRIYYRPTGPQAGSSRTWGRP